MPQETSTPPFVVIEGLDGAGTTTQSTLLVEHLRAHGRPALLTCEPTDGAIGKLIRTMIAARSDSSTPPPSRETLALLFAADRLEHLRAEVEPALAEGSVVVSDRYYHSSFAYQGDPNPQDPGDLELRWVRTLNERALIPDLTIFLEAPVDLCLARLGERPERDIFETREHLARMEKRYAQIMETLRAQGERIVRLDAALSREALAKKISALLEF